MGFFLRKRLTVESLQRAVHHGSARLAGVLVAELGTPGIRPGSRMSSSDELSVPETAACALAPDTTLDFEIVPVKGVQPSESTPSSLEWWEASFPPGLRDSIEENPLQSTRIGDPRCRPSAGSGGTPVECALRFSGRRGRFGRGMGPSGDGVESPDRGTGHGRRFSSCRSWSKMLAVGLVWSTSGNFRARVEVRSGTRLAVSAGGGFP